MVDALNYRAGELSQLESGRKRARGRRQDEANQCKLPRTKLTVRLKPTLFASPNWPRCRDNKLARSAEARGALVIMLCRKVKEQGVAGRRRAARKNLEKKELRTLEKKKKDG